MLAVIATGGKQYLVREHEKIKVEKLTLEVGASLNFEPLLVATEDGAEVAVGLPAVTGAQVETRVIEQGRAPKVVVQKYKNKTRYRRFGTHRQPFSVLEIVSIKK